MATNNYDIAFQILQQALDISNSMNVDDDFNDNDDFDNQMDFLSSVGFNELKYIQIRNKLEETDCKKIS